MLLLEESGQSQPQCARTWDTVALSVMLPCQGAELRSSPSSRPLVAPRCYAFGGKSNHVFPGRRRETPLSRGVLGTATSSTLGIPSAAQAYFQGCSRTIHMRSVVTTKRRVQQVVELHICRRGANSRLLGLKCILPWNAASVRVAGTTVFFLFFSTNIFLAVQ